MPLMLLARSHPRLQFRKTFCSSPSPCKTYTKGSHLSASSESGNPRHAKDSVYTSFSPSFSFSALSSETHASCAIFERCFNVSMKGDFSFFVPTKSDVDFLIGIILYNIALACQQEGQRRNSQRRVYSEKALRIYNMSASVLQGFDATRENLAVLLAISNNMACLSLDNFDFEAFHSYREWVGCLIIANKEFHSVFFFSNFASTKTVHERPAPAA